MIDLEFWTRKNIGEKAVEYLKKNVHPSVSRSVWPEDHVVVLLNASGFDAPDWVLRVSLANLADDVDDNIGRGVRSLARGDRGVFQVSKRAPRI